MIDSQSCRCQKFEVMREMRTVPSKAIMETRATIDRKLQDAFCRWNCVMVVHSFSRSLDSNAADLECRSRCKIKISPGHPSSHDGRTFHFHVTLHEPASMGIYFEFVKKNSTDESRNEHVASMRQPSHRTAQIKISPGHPSSHDGRTFHFHVTLHEPASMGIYFEFVKKNSTDESRNEHVASMRQPSHRTALVIF